MKMLVETTGDFMLMQTTTGFDIQSDRPCVVAVDAWVHNQLGLKSLVVLNNDLPDTATDEDFLTYWKECKRDKAMAVPSYLSQFAPVEAEPAVSKPKK